MCWRHDHPVRRRAHSMTLSGSLRVAQCRSPACMAERRASETAIDAGARGGRRGGFSGGLEPVAECVSNDLTSIRVVRFGAVAKRLLKLEVEPHGHEAGGGRTHGLTARGASECVDVEATTRSRAPHAASPTRQAPIGSPRPAWSSPTNRAAPDLVDVG